MLKNIDYSVYPITKIFYPGREEKISLYIDENYYYLKFPMISKNSLTYSHVNEYIAAKIFKLFNVDVIETKLVNYKDKEAILIKDFINKNTFIPLETLFEEQLDKSDHIYTYSYNDIVEVINSNNNIKNKKDILLGIFKCYILNALIGNFDCFENCLGFLITNNQYCLSPYYRFTNCLYPSLITDKDIQDALNNIDYLEDISLNGNFKIDSLIPYENSFLKIISSKKYYYINQALIKICEAFDFNKINKIIDETIFINDLRKTFYKKLIMYRYKHILKPTYEGLIKNDCI